MFLLVLILAMLLLKFPKDILVEFLIASIITLLWVTFSGIYNYQDANLVFLNISLYPFISWIFGLVILKEVYEFFKENSKKNSIYVFPGMIVLYVIALVFLEFTFYHFLGVRLSSSYSGLFGFDVLHAPWFGKIYYLVIGPFYLILTDLLNVK